MYHYTKYNGAFSFLHTYTYLPDLTNKEFLLCCLKKIQGGEKPVCPDADGSTYSVLRF